jgi:hypothetical protein
MSVMILVRMRVLCKTKNDGPSDVCVVILAFLCSYRESTWVQRGCIRNNVERWSLSGTFVWERQCIDAIHSQDQKIDDAVYPQHYAFARLACL